MQILIKEQVRYCRIVTKRSAALDYCLGISFQGKLFTSDKFFPGDRQQQAIDYCQDRYLADGGKRSYILLTNVAGLTVWKEDKVAQIVGTESIEDLICDLDLASSIAQMQNIVEIFEGDRQNNLKTNKLTSSLKTSLQEIIGLVEKVQSGYWQSVGIKPFEGDRYGEAI